MNTHPGTFNEVSGLYLLASFRIFDTEPVFPRHCNNERELDIVQCNAHTW